MSTVSAFKALLILNASWCVRGDGHAKKLESKHLIALSDRRSRLNTSAGEVSLRFRDKNGDLQLDNDARVTILEESGTVFLHSVQLAKDLLSRPIHDALLFLHFEQASDVVRATVHFSSFARLNQLSEERPELRFASYDLPPNTVTDVEPSLARDGMDGDSLYEALVNHTQQEDPELFAVHTEKFLKAPHILVPLLSHLASLSAEDNLKFPIQLRRLSDQFRTILEMKELPIGINKIERNHLDVWTEAQNKRYAFVDGGVAKIAGLPGTEPTAMRVGIYCVRAGDANIKTREQWDLQPFVVGDVIDKNTGVPMDDDDQMDLRRLGEAARYTLEPLTALRFIDRNSDVAAVFLHGPLINQFVMYDEGEPHFIPFLRREFLLAAGISQADVEGALKDIPSREGTGKMWRQFMAVYGYIIARVYDSESAFCRSG